MVLLLVVGLLSVTTASWADTVTLAGEKTGAIRPVETIVGDKKIEGSYFGGWKGAGPPETALLDERKESVSMVLKNKKVQSNAGFSNGFGQANYDGNKRASIAGFEDNNDVLKGGVASAGEHRGVGRFSESGNVQHRDFSSGSSAINTRGINADAVDNNQPLTNTKFESDFSHKGSSHEYNVDPSRQSDSSGEGVIKTVKDGKSYSHAYTMEEKGDDMIIEFKDDPNRPGSFIGSSSNVWTCKAEELAPSTCYDGNGKPAGSVVYNAQGETVVYDKNKMIIGQSESGRIAGGNDQQYEAIAAGGTLIATTDRLEEKDCYDDMYSKLPANKKDPKYKGNKITIENFELTWHKRKMPDGSEKIEFPDCFKIEYDVKLPPGMSFSEVEYQLDFHAMPLGAYECTDAGTCARLDTPCAYCDLCTRQENVETLENSKGNECDDDASGTKHVVRTICPTPEQSQYVLCNGFDRTIIGNDYYKYDGAINAKIHFYHTPGRDALKKEFLTKWNAPSTFGLHAFQSSWKTQYNLEAAKTGTNVFGSGPEEWELMEYYVDKNIKSALAGCTQGVVDYDLGGTKVSSNQLADWFVAFGSKNKATLFKQDNCKEWQNLQAEEYKAAETEFQASSSSSGSGSTPCTGFLCSFQSRLGGFGRRRK